MTSTHHPHIHQCTPRGKREVERHSYTHAGSRTHTRASGSAINHQAAEGKRKALTQCTRRRAGQSVRFVTPDRTPSTAHDRQRDAERLLELLAATCPSCTVKVNDLSVSRDANTPPRVARCVDLRCPGCCWEVSVSVWVWVDLCTGWCCSWRLGDYQETTCSNSLLDIDPTHHTSIPNVSSLFRRKEPCLSHRSHPPATQRAILACLREHQMCVSRKAHRIGRANRAVRLVGG